MYKPDLRNYSIEELKDLMSSLGEPPYRGEQVFHWITCKNAHSCGKKVFCRRTHFCM